MDPRNSLQQHTTKCTRLCTTPEGAAGVSRRKMTRRDPPNGSHGGLLDSEMIAFALISFGLCWRWITEYCNGVGEGFLIGFYSLHRVHCKVLHMGPCSSKLRTTCKGERTREQEKERIMISTEQMCLQKCMLLRSPEAWLLAPTQETCLYYS